MTKVDAVREFKNQYIGLYINHVDYWTAFEAWTFYKDGLCKDGQITQRQYDIWSTPFPYGKPLSPTKSMLEECLAAKRKGGEA